MSAKRQGRPDPALLGGMVVAGMLVLVTACYISPVPSGGRPGDGPLITLPNTSLAFEMTEGGNAPASKTMQIRNGGSGTLQWSCSADEDWLLLTPTTGATQSETSEVSVSVDGTGLSAASSPYEAEVTVTASGAANSPQRVSVTLTVNPPGGTSGDGVILGQVVDIDREAIAGADVVGARRQTQTDENGLFGLDELDAGSNVVLRFSKDGYASTVKAITPSEEGQPAVVGVVMVEAGETVSFDAGETTQQRSGNSAVTIPGGSLVDSEGNPVAGTVDLTTTYIDPSTKSIVAFPGSFNDAQNEAGETVTLESFGFSAYELSQNGAEVNLAPGSTAEIEYVLPENAQDRFAAGDTIGSWEFDEDTATWLEAGEGDVRTASDGSGRLASFSEVEHFSDWQAGDPIDTQCVAGTVR